MKVLIKDKSASIRFKLDIGVHTLLGIEQETFCFEFSDEEKIMLKINPPEQVFAEKLYSLAKHSFLSTRFKDVYDMYYFISQGLLDIKTVRKCLELLVAKQNSRIKTIEDVCSRVDSAFEDKVYLNNLKSMKDNWLEVDYQIIINSILDYICKI